MDDGGDSRHVDVDGAISLLQRPSLAAFLEYIGSMKVKTSITLSDDVLKRLDRAAKRGENRSQAIERLLRERLQAEARKAADSRDLALIV